MYYSIALAYLPSKLMLYASSSTQLNVEKVAITDRPKLGFTLFLFLFLLGASVPIAEQIVPGHHFEELTDTARNNLLQEEFSSTTGIDSFLQEENAVFFSGVTLYPRYFRSDNRMFLGDISKNYRYLHFWLINDSDYQIVLPLQDTPDVFPHTSTVSVIGCKEDNHILAWAVIMHAPTKQILISSPGSPMVCPPVEPN